MRNRPGWKLPHCVFPLAAGQAGKSRRAGGMLAFSLGIVIATSVVSSQSAPAQSTWQKMKLQFLEQACKGGDQNSCRQLALLKQKLSQQGQTPQGQQPPQPPGQQPQGARGGDLHDGSAATTAPAESTGQPADSQSTQAPTPPTGDATATTPAGRESADSNSAQPWTAPAVDAAPSRPGPLDPMKLPDIQGIHPGMTVTQANEVMAKLAPGARVPWYNSAMVIPTSNIVVGHAASQVTVQYDWVDVGGGAKDYKLEIAMEATRPPNQERIWHIGLRAQHQYVNRAVLLGALRKKYGKELAATDENGQPTTDDSRVANLWWAFDEQGRPRSPALSMVNGSPNGCGDPGYGIASLARYGSGGGNSSSSGKDTDPGCMWVGVRATIPPVEIVTYYFLALWDAPLSVRDFKVTDAWLQVQLEKARQEALQKSKEAKPVM